MLTNWHAFSPVWKSRLSWGAAITVGSVLYLKVLSPAFNISIPCPVHALTGLYCPGCGFTRALTSLLEFDLIQAFRFNPVIFLLLPIYGLYSLLRIRGYKRSSEITMTAMVVLTVSFGVLRNFPMFAELAPVQLQ